MITRRISELEEFYLPDEFFSHPIQSDSGDADVKVIYIAVGEALDIWESVEQIFARLFYTFCDNSYAAARAYGSIMSGGGRAEALEAASIVYYAARGTNQDEKACCSHLVNKFKTAGGLRNRIAHGAVIRFDVGDSTTYGNFLAPPDYNTGKTHAFPQGDSASDPLAWTGTKYRFTSKDISLLADRFRTLRTKANDYHGHLRATYPNSLIPKWY